MAEDTTKVDAEVVTETEATEVESDEKSESTLTDSDYEAELEAEKKRAPDPEKAKEAFRKREEKRRQEEAEEEVDEEDKPLTRRELEALLNQRTQQIQKETQQERISEIARSLAGSAKEAELIVEIHKNRTFPQGMSLTEQLEEAYVIANRRKILAKNTELARAVASRETTSKDVASTHRDPMEGPRPKMATADEAVYQRTFDEYDSKAKAWKKKLPSGKTLYKDPKTKRTWTV